MGEAINPDGCRPPSVPALMSPTRVNLGGTELWFGLEPYEEGFMFP